MFASFSFTEGTFADTPTAYSIACSAGSYALTGNAIGFNFNRRLNADAGNYALTGNAVVFNFNRRLDAAAGAYALTGYDASFKIAKGFNLGAGTYTFEGKDATLTYSNNAGITVTKGGIDKKKTKSKVYKDSRQEVEDDIARAIAKVTGKDKPPEPELVDNSLEAEIKAAEETNLVRLQEMVMNAQAMALQAEIDRLIQDELDDEESLMLLL